MLCHLSVREGGSGIEAAEDWGRSEQTADRPAAGVCAPVPRIITLQCLIIPFQILSFSCRQNQTFKTSFNSEKRVHTDLYQYKYIYIDKFKFCLSNHNVLPVAFIIGFFFLLFLFFAPFTEKFGVRQASLWLDKSGQLSVQPPLAGVAVGEREDCGGEAHMPYFIVFGRKRYRKCFYVLHWKRGKCLISLPLLRFY